MSPIEKNPIPNLLNFLMNKGIDCFQGSSMENYLRCHKVHHPGFPPGRLSTLFKWPDRITSTSSNWSVGFIIPPHPPPCASVPSYAFGYSLC